MGFLPLHSDAKNGETAPLSYDCLLVLKLYSKIPKISLPLLLVLLDSLKHTPMTLYS